MLSTDEAVEEGAVEDGRGVVVRGLLLLELVGAAEEDRGVVVEIEAEDAGAEVADEGAAEDDRGAVVLVVAIEGGGAFLTHEFVILSR